MLVERAKAKAPAKVPVKAPARAPARAPLRAPARGPTRPPSPVRPPIPPQQPARPPSPSPSRPPSPPRPSTPPKKAKGDPKHQKCATIVDCTSCITNKCHFDKISFTCANPGGNTLNKVTTRVGCPQMLQMQKVRVSMALLCRMFLIRPIRCSLKPLEDRVLVLPLRLLTINSGMFGTTSSSERQTTPTPAVIRCPRSNRTTPIQTRLIRTPATRS